MYRRCYKAKCGYWPQAVLQTKMSPGTRHYIWLTYGILTDQRELGISNI